jgi:hypothetical protein
MRFQRRMLGAAFLAATLVVTGQSQAAGTKPYSLQMLAARQDLRDMVCYAKADGTISPFERSMILREAKGILSNEEYVKFKKAFDRISPPPKKKVSPSRLAKATQKRLAPPQQAVEPASGPVIPAGALLPDRMATPPRFR